MRRAGGPADPSEAALRLERELELRGLSEAASVRVEGRRVILSARLDPLRDVRRARREVRAELAKMAARDDHPGHVQSAAGDLISQIDAISSQFDGASLGVEVSVYFSAADPPSLVEEFERRMREAETESKRVQRLARSILTYARELLRSRNRAGLSIK